MRNREVLSSITTPLTVACSQCIANRAINNISLILCSCEKQFLSEKSTKAHFNRVHLRKDIGNHRCDSCDITFQTYSGMKNHSENVHENKRHFQCKLCDKRFGYKNHLKKHILSVHLRRRDYDCSYCEKKFSGKGDLDRHVMTVHKKKCPRSKVS